MLILSIFMGKKFVGVSSPLSGVMVVDPIMSVVFPSGPILMGVPRGGLRRRPLAAEDVAAFALFSRDLEEETKLGPKLDIVLNANLFHTFGSPEDRSPRRCPFAGSRPYRGNRSPRGTNENWKRQDRI